MAEDLEKVVHGKVMDLNITWCDVNGGPEVVMAADFKAVTCGECQSAILREIS